MNDLVPKKFKIDLDEDTKQKCITDIERYFIIDDWCKEVPHYQTYPVLFERDEDHWKKLRHLFFNAFLSATGQCPSHMKAWAYVSFVEKPGSISDRWHDHYEINADKISSVLYLQCEDRKNGTMFLCGENIIVPLVYLDTIYIFDSKLMHSPTTWDYKNKVKNRIVVAVDSYF